MYPLIGDLSVSGETLLLILVVLGIVIAVIVLFKLLTGRWPV